MITPTRRRLDINALCERLGKTSATIYRWYTPGSQGYCDLPKPHYLGRDRNWFEDEIVAWEEKRMAGEKKMLCNLEEAAA